MRRLSLFIVFLISTGCHCGDNPSPFTATDGASDASGDASGDSGGLDGSQATGDSGLDSGLVGDDCAERAKWIYVVDNNDNFFRFEPNNLSFHQIGSGPLVCPNTTFDGGVSHPFSMAIDENAVAYVLYDDGELYRVSTLDGTCEATTYVPGQSGFTLFGMGFSSNNLLPNRNGETLFIARGLSSPDELGTLNVNTMTVSFVAGISGVPELTGNGNAELWGFFPDPTTSTIRKMNKATGATVTEYDLTTSSPDTITMGNLNAWAFAFWGGSYYVFYKSSNDTSTDVYRLTPGPTVQTSTFTRVIDNSGRRIVGAGVSTCAPVVID